MFNESDIIAALSEKFHKPASVAILELLAARRAARFVQEIGLHQSHFKGDSKAGVKALQIRDSSFFWSLCQGHFIFC